jgi:hypothetical protein
VRRDAPAATRAIAAIVAMTLAPGCATLSPDKGPSVVGRRVSVKIGSEKEKVEGELLLVDKERLYVRAENGVREIPMGAVREARVKRHNFGMSRTLAWSAIAGLVTGGALAAACGSVEDTSGCGGALLVTLGAWLAVGAACGASMEASSRVTLEKPTAAELRAFARLPQGLPPGVTPAMLGPATEAPAQK